MPGPSEMQIKCNDINDEQVPRKINVTSFVDNNIISAAVIAPAADQPFRNHPLLLLLLCPAVLLLGES